MLFSFGCVHCKSHANPATPIVRRSFHAVAGLPLDLLWFVIFAVLFGWPRKAGGPCCRVWCPFLWVYCVFFHVDSRDVWGCGRKEVHSLLASSCFWFHTVGLLHVFFSSRGVVWAQSRLCRSVLFGSKNNGARNFPNVDTVVEVQHKLAINVEYARL